MEPSLCTITTNPVIDRLRRTPSSATAADVRTLVRHLDQLYDHNTLEYPYNVTPRIRETLKSNGWTVRDSVQLDYVCEVLGVAGSARCAFVLPFVDTWPVKSLRVDTVAMLRVVYADRSQYAYANLGDAVVDVANRETKRGYKLADAADIYAPLAETA